MVEEINVHIGEVKTGSDSQILRALLGSCVGIAILWPERNLCGLAHCLLASSPNKQFEIGAKYVDQAIYSLLRMMNVSKDDYKKVRAVVAGGGNMLSSDIADTTTLVGYINKKKAINTLNELNINIIHEDTGGRNGRKISVDCKTGGFKIYKIPRPDAAGENYGK